MNNFTEDTIIALATPPGIGAISIIRISGNQSIKSVDSIFQGKIKLTNALSHTIHYGKIYSENNNLIDDVLIFIYKGPNSYTGEDSVEISTHGSPIISEKIIDLLLKRDVRLAEPGEFTKRAFMNNRLDLAQAEAVADIINSRTEASLKGARNQLDGLLSQKVQELRSGLINASSFVELGLDFAEEDIEFIDNSELLNRIEKISNEINNLLDTYSFGRVIRDGVNVALVGQPNVGKSSILNYILKESRSIVSKLPGTTRDIIREEVSIDGILFKLFDTAGIRSSEDEIEKEGIYRSREAIKNADIVLLIHDVEQQLDDKILTEVYSLTTKEKVLIVFNKIDLIKTEQALEKICVSALTGKGMENLLTKLKSLALGNSVYSEKSEVISSLRHYHCLSKANEYLDLAKKSILNKLSSEFISVDLRNAENSLGEIIGLVTTDDILNNIFMSFCIGK
ncbi:MAG: tRNA uridine-5-carboxymethylaminomethyl(34) synthesis GTPase MnmE [Ignavibacteriaceae bacterium]